MSELKPCPFCGGESEVVELESVYLYGFVARCANEDCIIVAETDMCPTEAEAVEAWNTRAERTCENISDPPEGFLCSSCGWGDFAEPSHLLTTAKFAGNDKGPNHCPNCGARVVGE